MKHELTLAGRPVTLEWTVESKKRFQYRLQTIGGHPPESHFKRAATAPAAFARVLWAMLPKQEVALYESPEDLFAAIDHDTEYQGILTAVSGVYKDMAVSAEKKMTSDKSPSPESNSD